MEDTHATLDDRTKRFNKIFPEVSPQFVRQSVQEFDDDDLVYTVLFQEKHGLDKVFNDMEGVNVALKESEEEERIREMELRRKEVEEVRKYMKQEEEEGRLEAKRREQERRAMEQRKKEEQERRQREQERLEESRKEEERKREALRQKELEEQRKREEQRRELQRKQEEQERREREVKELQRRKEEEERKEVMRLREQERQIAEERERQRRKEEEERRDATRKKELLERQAAEDRERQRRKEEEERRETMRIRELLEHQAAEAKEQQRRKEEEERREAMRKREAERQAAEARELQRRKEEEERREAMRIKELQERQAAEAKELQRRKEEEEKREAFRKKELERQAAEARELQRKKEEEDLQRKRSQSIAEEQRKVAMMRKQIRRELESKYSEFVDELDELLAKSDWNRNDVEFILANKRSEKKFEKESVYGKYDLVLDLEVMVDVEKGWDVEIAPHKKKKIRDLLEPIYSECQAKGALEGEWMKLEDKLSAEVGKIIVPLGNNAITVSVAGFFNRGKTHILNNLTGNALPSGSTVTTKGISVKIPVNPSNRFVLLDTAGTNSPIQLELLERTTEELRNKHELPTEKPQYLDLLQQVKDERDIAKREHLEEKIKSIKKSEIEVVRKRAMVNKKATEEFLQNYIFQLSDAIVFVVNEMTWPDQQTLEVLSMKLQQETAHRSSKLNRVIVVHNLKDVKTDSMFTQLRKKFVEDCYQGDLSANEVAVPGRTTKEIVYSFETANRDMTHIFLAQDNSEAGNLHNEATYLFLTNLLNSLVAARKDQFLTSICRTARSVLDPYFAGGISEVSFYYNLKLDKIVLRATSRQQPLKLLRDQITYDGLYLTLAAPSTFLPNCDVICKKEYMLVVVDLPGVSIIRKKKEATNESYVDITVDRIRDELKIRGNRLLYHHQVVQGEKELMIAPGGKQTYSRENTQENALFERKEGPFERIFKIPPEYERNKKAVKSLLENGKLQVIIPRVVESDDEED